MSSNVTTRVYIAGPMSNLPDFNRPAFNAAAARLRAMGFHVENPAENTAPVCGTWEGWMRKAIAQLIACDEVALLPGWEASRGAVIEFNLARSIGMRARPIEQIEAAERRVAA